MNALEDFFMRVPKWTLPIMMVAPAVVLSFVAYVTDIAGPEYQRVRVPLGEVALVISPETENCKKQFVLMDGCIPRILGPGVHIVRADYTVEEWRNRE